MAKSTTIRARLERELGDEAKDVTLPNATTRRIFRETDRGENLFRCENLDNMFEKLGI